MQLVIFSLDNGEYGIDISCVPIAGIRYGGNNGEH
jgi:hypothetical protein